MGVGGGGGGVGGGGGGSARSAIFTKGRGGELQNYKTTLPNNCRCAHLSIHSSDSFKSVTLTV